jgi:hypothetical protein
MKRIALLLLLPLVAIAAEAPRQTTRATGAIVFKNGLAFITREGNVSFANGVGTVSPVPDAYLGTLWVSANGRTLDELRATKDSYETTRNAVSISDLIDANAGKAATIRVDKRDYSGTLVAPAPAALPVEAETADGTVAVDSALVLINVDGRIHAFPRNAVESVSFAEAPVTTLRASGSRTTLTLHSKGAEGSVPVTISYLRGGVSWMPEYSVALIDDSNARLTMRATLLDDSEELRDTNVRFAVGYPNFQFASVQSPLTPQQSLQQFLGRVGANRYDNVVMSNVLTQNITTNSTTGGSPDFTPEVPAFGETSEDLFFYERPNVTLAAGERAAYPILAMTVPFRHIYKWEVSAETESTRDDPEEESKPGQVWHSIALTNGGTTPWTTGPAFVLANGKPLAEDTLSYTAAGATGSVKLTLATDVSVSRGEKETGRELHALTAAGYHWTQLSVEGTLRVRSFKHEPITLSVDKLLEGATFSSTPDAKITKRAVSPRAVNPRERLQWEVPLAPGEAKTLRYSYKIYVRE